MKDLIIVESPTKAKTIKNFLGDKFEVIASKGHIRDLPKHSFGIKIDNGVFEPQYKIDTDHKEIVEQLKKLSKSAKQVYIATDEDREGEAIGYHIAVAIGAEPSKLPRIVFHEITQNAIEHSLKNPRHIDMQRVNAQQARRLLDRIVGYRLSPLIASKIQRGLSAGRVQSAALKIVVDREREIKAFKPTAYYTIETIFKENLEAELTYFNKQKLGKLTISSKKQADFIVDFLKKSNFSITNIEHKKRKVSPSPPFMTSTLQQSASSQLGYSASRTMQIAQKLYEGVQTHKGTMGVITYMRTDSLNIAKEAQQEAKKAILDRFGKDYAPPKMPIYTTKSKNAQEAHEAIRPTLIDFTPEIAKEYLKPEEYKLYTLIYKRFLASQMSDAEFELQTITISASADNSTKSAELKLSGRKLLFAGFHAINPSEDKDKLLPNLKEGDKLELEKCSATRKETEPPPRYSEASLIKKLEELGIGRPSTYAPTISLLTNRNYISIVKKQLVPEEIAERVIEVLEVHFNEIVDSHFSANMEEKLDNIADKGEDWQKVLNDFYIPFMQQITEGKETIKSQKVTIPTGEQCPLCGSELVKKNSRYGEFVGCSAFPKCRYIKKDEPENTEDLGVCEKCGKPMVKKMSRNGAFLACSGYPECKNAKPLNLSAKESTPKAIIDIPCPLCGGEIIQRMGRFGVFYSCANYPKCKFTCRFQPTKYKCECGGMLLSRTFRGSEVFECASCKQRIPKDEYLKKHKA